ncbi:hypothetical protein ACFCYN_22660 [Gottfriedia sp. NPDC056225]|uniref:hypothetical protein n=1 Tax=Gottfriedia sp. NPDC056225 TaxID=3345751 RepID=UPI0035E15737
MKNPQEIKVLISSLTILIIGIIIIYFYAERNERSFFILNLGAIMIIFQQLAIRVLRSKKVKHY